MHSEWEFIVYITGFFNRVSLIHKNHQNKASYHVRSFICTDLKTKEILWVSKSENSLLAWYLKGVISVLTNWSCGTGLWFNVPVLTFHCTCQKEGIQVYDELKWSSKNKKIVQYTSFNQSNDKSDVFFFFFVEPCFFKLCMYRCIYKLFLF